MIADTIKTLDPKWYQSLPYEEKAVILVTIWHSVFTTWMFIGASHAADHAEEVTLGLAAWLDGEAA